MVTTTGPLNKPWISFILEPMIRHENGILNYIQCFLLLGLFAATAYHYFQHPTSHYPISGSRAILNGVYILLSLELVALALRATTLSTSIKDTHAAVSLNSLATIIVLMLALAAHYHNKLVPQCFNLYFFVGILVDSTESVWFFHREFTWAGRLAATTGFVRLLLFLLNYVFQPWFPDDDADFWISNKLDAYDDPTLSVFVCLSPTFLTRFQSGSSLQDLRNLGRGFSSKLLHAQLRRKWQRSDPSRPHGLVITCAQTWKGSVVAALSIRAAVSAFSFAYPFVLHQVICAILQTETDSEEKRRFLILIVLICAGRSVSRAASSHATNRLTTQVRGGLTAMVFEKHQNLSKANGGKPVSLEIIRSDVGIISAGVPMIIRTLFTLIDTCLGVYFLSFFIGNSALAMLIPLATSCGSAYFFGNRLATSKRLWNESFAARQVKTSSTLAQLPATRMIGLAYMATEYITSLQTAELEHYRVFQTIRSASKLSAAFSSILAPTFVIATACFTGSLRADAAVAVIFPILNLLSLHSNPLAALLHDYPDINGMLVSFSQIQQFLLLEERKDPRIVSAHESNSHTPVIASSSQSVVQQFQNRPPNFLQFSLASIIPYGTDSPVYTNIDFSLRPGSITAVVGARRSGKSTLLEAMLGETKIRDGTIYVGDNIVGFSGECVWLQDLSVRDNVIGPHRFDIRRFKLVIRCCLLQEDLKKFPGGDCFIIGVGGSKLSNGQRQRLALARAVYADPSLLLLDDAFSSLDRRTAASILFRLCGKDGLLKSSRCTVVFATSLAETADLADQFLLLNATDHSIRFQPNNGQLKIAEFLRAQHVVASEAVEEKQRNAIHRALNDPTTGKTATAIANGSANSGKQAIIAHLFNSMGALNLVFLCCMVSLLSLGEKLPEIHISKSLEIELPYTEYIKSYFAINVFTCLLSPFVFWVLYVQLSPRASAHLHGRLLNTLMRSSLGYLGTSDPDSILQRLGKSLHQTTDMLPTCLFRVFYYGTALVTQCVVLANGSKSLTLFLLFIIYRICSSFVCKSRQIRAIHAKRTKLLQTLFQETAEGLVHCRALGWQAFHFEQGLRLMDDSLKAFFYVNHVEGWAESITSIFTSSIITSVTAMALYSDDRKPIAAVALSLHCASYFGETIWKVCETTIFSDEAKSTMSDLLSWLHQTPQEAEPPAIELPENWPHEGRIELRNVSAKYGPNMPDVLVNVSLTVNPQDKVCIFGRTGSGKSTFLLALLGFLEYSGKIEIDGIDIATVPRHILRSRIISISQEQVELDGTIRSNLLPYEPTVPDGETEADRVASVADIDAYLQEFLSDIGIWTEIQDKGGLYTTLGSAGLSKVMIKTLCFARAVLRYHRSEGRLVLLDEATNGLDPEQDTAVQKSIWRFFEGCSIVQIAHLKESTEDSELSVEISGGKIVHVQRGPELLPGVESRSRPLMSPDSMIMSAGSESATPNRVSSPGDQMMPPDDDTLSLDRQIIPDIPALEPLDDDLVPPDELMLSLRDHMMSPRFVPPSDSGIVPPGAHRVPSMYRSTPSVSGVSTSIAPNQRQATNYGKLWVSSAAFSNKLQQYGQMPDAQGNYNTAQNDIPTFDYESTLDCDYPRAFGRGPNPFVAPAKDAALHHGYADNQHSGYRYQPAPNYQPMPNYSTAPSQYPSANYQPVPDHSQSTHIQDSSVSLQPMPDRGPLTNFNRILDYGLRSRSGAESNTGDPSTSGDASSYYSGSSYESGSARSVRMFH